ncbi:ATP-grasp domain-containing protein [Patescibacteria group bacterium]
MTKIDYSQINNTVVKNLLKEAQKNGIQVKQVDANFLTFSLEHKNKRHYFFHKKIGINPANAALVSNKFLTIKILKEAGIKVPNAFLAEDIDQVRKLLKQKKIKFPFVIKPFDYSLGVAVTANITDMQMIRMAIARLNLYWRKAKIWGKKKRRKLFLVEEHVKGNDYRLLVLNNKVVAVTQRTYPEIVGNGQSSVLRLIQDYYKNHAYYQVKQRSPLIDQELKRNLKQQAVNFKTILKKGKVIRLRQTANVFGGGVSINVTNKVHPSYKKIAIDACREIGLSLAGVDLMTKDISKKSDNYRIIEINSFPSLDMHENPDQGKPINVSKEILKSIFPGLK